MARRSSASRAPSLWTARLSRRRRDVTDGTVIVDGDKTDGVESSSRSVADAMRLGTPLSKAHGKIFTLVPGADFSDWAAQGLEVEGGLSPCRACFPPTGSIPGSRWLADCLPETWARM